jgi:hypothetical protein
MGAEGAPGHEQGDAHSRGNGPHGRGDEGLRGRNVMDGLCGQAEDEGGDAERRGEPQPTLPGVAGEGLPDGRLGLLDGGGSGRRFATPGILTRMAGPLPADLTPSKSVSTIELCPI